jgi:hypothetical protein
MRSHHQEAEDKKGKADKAPKHLGCTTRGCLAMLSYLRLAMSRRYLSIEEPEKAQ